MALDIMAAFTNEPPELDFVLPGFLAGSVGALFSPGATGKSFLVLEAAMGVACSVAGGDLLNLQPGHTGRVVYLAAEDPEPVLLRRLYSIGKHLNPAARDAIAEHLTLEPLMGKRLDVMKDEHMARLLEYCDGARLIVIDTISRVHQLDENSNGDMGRLLQALEYLAAQTGAAVLFLHHVSKSSAASGQGDQQHAARGASILTDNARWGAALSKMAPDEADLWSDSISLEPIGDRRNYYVRFSVPKNNYGEPIEDRWFKRAEGGVLIPVTLLPAKAENAKRGGRIHDAAAY